LYLAIFQLILEGFTIHLEYEYGLLHIKLIHLLQLFLKLRDKHMDSILFHQTSFIEIMTVIFEVSLNGFLEKL